MILSQTLGIRSLKPLMLVKLNLVETMRLSLPIYLRIRHTLHTGLDRLNVVIDALT